MKTDYDTIKNVRIISQFRTNLFQLEYFFCRVYFILTLYLPLNSAIKDQIQFLSVSTKISLVPKFVLLFSIPRKNSTIECMELWPCI